MKTVHFLIIIGTMLLFVRCSNNEKKYTEDFNRYPDRVWVNEHLWTIPLEDWKIENKRVECIGNRANMRLNLLTYKTMGYGDYVLAAKMGIAGSYSKPGTAGFRIGVNDNTDDDIRSLCYFGKGVDVGVNTDGFIFIGKKQQELPEGYSLSDFQLTAKVTRNSDKNTVTLIFKDTKGNTTALTNDEAGQTEGAIQFVNNFNTEGSYEEGPNFWFDDISLQGSMVKPFEKNTFGPVLWAMYTLSKGTLNITAQMPPLDNNNKHEVSFQVKRNNKWKTLKQSEISKKACIAEFKVKGWDEKQDVPYRMAYEEKYTDGSSKMHYYEGKIRKEPGDGKLKMGGMTCQYHYGFPYRPLVDNLKLKNPDLLYFSGDQIYEFNGGYYIIREPADRAILNYLGKWYMFGWAFGELMRDRPTICIPDDHEVYQGNLWGEGGNDVTLEKWEKQSDCTGGFVQPVDMINVVVHTNCSHLPDPYDPTPMKQNINVYYTDLVYGGISFGIVGDRIFKTGPQAISFWEGRKDHLKQELEDPSVLDNDTLKLLGDRQMEFLRHWTENWEDAEMKVFLSQTIFANVATHHGGNRMFLVGDLDSGGWPKSARDNTVSQISKSFAFHICGDQHLPSLVHYGINKCRDAGWVFCTPAIAVGYQRFFLPDELGWPVNNRPEHGNPNTGCYTDAFGNINYVYAIGNPADQNTHTNRYQMAELKSSGFGFINFNLDKRDINIETYHFMANLHDDNTKEDQFPGWPKTINQIDNYAREAAAYLPTIKLKENNEPVIRIIEAQTGSLVYNIRMNGKKFTPKVFEEGEYIIEIGEGKNKKVFEGVKTIRAKDTKTLTID